ncbi:MAG TPA: SPOR domain-containing protein [Xanthomonadaceae bacterium]|nr:SPOR domain-containing protein [Xanthomonadaceae bacterium]
MIWRVLLLLLLAGNIGVGAWLLLGPDPSVRVQLVDVDPGVPRLVLLAERERERTDLETAAGAPVAAELAAAPEPLSALPAKRCHTLGPFSTQAELRRVMDVLAPLAERIQFREGRQMASRGYWVYIPPLPTRSEALGVARELSARGIRDYYVVTAGDQENTVSLGLFRDPDNAERRRAEVAALGFAPALRARSEEQNVWWVDMAEDPAAPVDWRSLLSTQAADTAREVPCG